MNVFVKPSAEPNLFRLCRGGKTTVENKRTFKIAQSWQRKQLFWSSIRSTERDCSTIWKHFSRTGFRSARSRWPTNSGVALRLDDTVSRLTGREEEYDALVFACGDAMPKFAENADKPFNREMLRIMKRFAEQGKPMIGHCAAALLYDNLGIARGRRVALHPFLKTVVRECIPTDDKAVVDGNFYTAQTENTLSELMPRVLQALK